MVRVRASENLVALHDLLALNDLVDCTHHVLHGCPEDCVQLWFRQNTLAQRAPATGLG